MLDHGGRGVFEAAHNGQRAVQVEQVVVGKLFAVKLFGGDQVGAFDAGVSEKSSLLVWVLPVTQHGLAAKANVQRPGERPFGRKTGKVVGNGTVVLSGMGERLGGQLSSQLKRSTAAGGDLLKDFRVLLRVGGDCGKRMVLRRCADHGRPSDVDLLNGLVDGDALSGNGGFKRVQVDHYQFEGHDPVLGQRFQILGVVVPAKNPPVDSRVQRFQTAVHHFGKSGIVGDVADGDAFSFQVFSRAAGAVDLYASGGQSTGEPRQPQLVTDADQRAFDRRRLHDVHPR